MNKMSFSEVLAFIICPIILIISIYISEWVTSYWVLVLPCICSIYMLVTARRLNKKRLEIKQ